MSLQDDFSEAAAAGMYYNMEKENDFVLKVSGTVERRAHRYDFLARMVTVSDFYQGVTLQAIPFSQLDPESLEFFRQKLIDLGGKPPELSNRIPKPRQLPTPQ